MELANSRVCAQCKTSTSLSSLKLLPSGQKDYALLCTGCADSVKQTRGHGAHTGEVSVKSVHSHASNSDKQLLICGHCRFKFRADLSQAGRSYNLRCQYCDRTDKLYDAKGGFKI